MFTKEGSISGRSVNVVRSISQKLDGTPMPSWLNTFPKSCGSGPAAFSKQSSGDHDGTGAWLSKMELVSIAESSDVPKSESASGLCTGIPVCIASSRCPGSGLTSTATRLPANF